MADFCWQCTEKHLGIPGQENDFRNQVPAGDTLQSLCEGCGDATMNHEGRCLGGCSDPDHQPEQ